MTSLMFACVTRLARVALTMLVAAAGATAAARSIFVGTGERYPTEVIIRFWRLE